jgi:hypothetical protein
MRRITDPHILGRRWDHSHEPMGLALLFIAECRTKSLLPLMTSVWIASNRHDVMLIGKFGWAVA